MGMSEKKAGFLLKTLEDIFPNPILEKKEVIQVQFLHPLAKNF